MMSRLKYKKFGKTWGPVEDKGHGVVRMWLNHERTSWVDAFMLPHELKLDKKQFDQLWNLHPDENGRVKVGGREVQVPRFQKTYGKSYWFSGMDHKADPIPDEVKPWLDYANTQQHATMYGFKGYNQVLINWYEPNHYIGEHSDSEGQLQKNSNGETTVYSVSFQPTGKPRIFRLKPKKTPDGCKANRDRIDIELTDGLVLVMGGMCQRTHTHQVPALGIHRQALSGRRINLTFRCFKE